MQASRGLVRKTGRLACVIAKWNLMQRNHISHPDALRTARQSRCDHDDQDMGCREDRRDVSYVRPPSVRHRHDVEDESRRYPRYNARIS